MVHPVSAPKAIETSYAGCRFRSRLEAKWAVFFDALGIKWQYEPQGYTVGPDHDQRAYLPDFWLPDQNLWVEVKGSISTHAELEKLVYAARYLPGAISASVKVTDNLVVCPGIVILGQVPLVQEGWLAWHKGYRFQEDETKYCPPQHYWTTLWYFRQGGLALSQETGIDLGTEGAFNLNLNSPSISKFDGHINPLWEPHWPDACDGPTARAYAAARSARFEHGQSGPYRGAP